MSDEIIKVLEYITSNSAAQIMFIVWTVFSSIILALVITVFIVVIRAFLKDFRK